MLFHLSKTSPGNLITNQKYEYPTCYEDILCMKTFIMGRGTDLPIQWLFKPVLTERLNEYVQNWISKLTNNLFDV